MSFDNLFPYRASLRLWLRLPFVCALLCAAFTSSVIIGYGQSRAVTNTRPAARLITSSRQMTSVPVTQAALMTSAAAGTVANKSSLSATSIERRVFELINEERRAHGETPLVWDAELCRMARQHSENMASEDFLDHTDRNGRDMMARASINGITGWRALRENIAYNQGFEDPAAFAVERWMKSGKHRANALDNEVTRTGVGVARASDGRIFFTQVFIAR